MDSRRGLHSPMGGPMMESRRLRCIEYCSDGSRNHRADGAVRRAAGIPQRAGDPVGRAGTMAAVVAGCLLGDSFWYVAGRRYGAGVMRLLCRISLSPDSCVQRSELRFQRWRGQVLLVAKFVPGLSTVGSSLVGAMRLRWPAFMLFDGR